MKNKTILVLSFYTLSIFQYTKIFFYFCNLSSSVVEKIHKFKKKKIELRQHFINLFNQNEIVNAFK